jgi:hypothetical protein
MAAGYTEEEAASIANSNMQSWDGGKEILGGAAAAGGLYALAKKGQERLRGANSPSTTSAAPKNTNTATGINNSSSSVMESSLNSSDSIVSQAAHTIKGAEQDLATLREKGAAQHYRELIAKPLAEKGHTSLANKLLSGADMTAEDFKKAGIDPSKLGLERFPNYEEYLMVNFINHLVIH